MPLRIKGINYDVGTQYFPDHTSRPVWTKGDVVRDMKAIREALHCNSVNLYGSDLSRLSEGAEIALQEGLSVSMQPRLIEGDRQQMLAFVEQGGRAAERLRKYGAVTLNTGCELSLFTRGFMPGRTFRARMRNLLWTWPFLPIFNRRLNRHLHDVVRVVRGVFDGPVTYGAGVWERVDWDRFDLVGVNLYRDRWNASTYTSDLRALHTSGKPVVATEFGCCTFEGAARFGGGGWTIVDFDVDPPVVKPGYGRSEQEQADVLDALLGIFDEEGLYGAYVFDFMAPGFPHDPDPERDLDKASYGVVKVLPSSPGEASIPWERKRAFDVIAARYGDASPIVRS